MLCPTTLKLILTINMLLILIFHLTVFRPEMFLFFAIYLMKMRYCFKPTFFLLYVPGEIMIKKVNSVIICVSLPSAPMWRVEFKGIFSLKHYSRNEKEGGKLNIALFLLFKKGVKISLLKLNF